MAKKEKDVPKNLSRLADEKHPLTLSPVKLFDIKQARAALANALKLSPGDQDVEDDELAEFLTNLGANLFATVGVRALTSNVASLLTITDKTKLLPSDKLHSVHTHSDYVPKLSVPSHVLTQRQKASAERVKRPLNPMQIEFLAAKRENARAMKCESRFRSRIRALYSMQIGPHLSVPLQKEEQFILESMIAKKQLENRLSKIKANVKIVVVGAGIAGLSAADQLISFGFRKVIVLEALDRVGGRIHSVPYNNQSNKLLEMGVAMVDHATEDNSVYSLIKQFGLIQQTPSDYRKESLIMFANGELMGSNVLNFLSLPSPVIHNDINLINSHIKSDLHRNVSLSYDDYIKERHRRFIHGQVHLTRSQHLPIATIVNRLTFTTKYRLGHTNDPLAVHLLGSSQDSERIVTLPCGMASLLDPLMANFKASTLKLNACVKKIERQMLESLDYPNVKITCSDGRIFRAHHVIVAVPLGHLKENADKMFQPALPAEKMNAINRVCFGTVGKMYLRYAKPFWSEPVNFIWLGTESAREKLWSETLLFKSLDLHPNMLEVCILGHAAETLPDFDVIWQLSSILSMYFGTQLPSPVHVRKTEWYSNPMFRGTHPYLSVECSKKEQSLLGEPLMNSGVPEVLFAGDYTYKDYSCLIHAARVSGLREANRIHNFYNTLRCFENINS